MITRVFSDYETLSLHAASTIVETVRQEPEAVLCLAAGDTPTRTYAVLAERAKSEGVSFSQCFFVGLDEWVGIPPENEGSCQFYLRRNLFEPLDIRSDQIHLFDGMSADLEEECRRMDSVIHGKGGIDLMLVGVGMNGHVGFNEPGASLEAYAHVTDLDATTQSVGQKYFRESTSLRRGITLGLRHFLESRKAILLASGSKKASIIRDALEGAAATNVPASAIQLHPAGIAMLDEEAAALLERKRSS